MIASLSFKTGDLIFFFCAWKSPDRFPTGCGLSLGRAWAGRSLLARLRLQFWKAEAAKSRVLPTAFRPSRAGTTLVRCAALWPCISKSQIYFIIFGTTLFRLLPSRWGTLNYFIFLSDRRNLQRLLALVWHITFLASRNLFMIILIDASLRLFLEWYMLPLILICFFLYLTMPGSQHTMPESDEEVQIQAEEVCSWSYCTGGWECYYCSTNWIWKVSDLLSGMIDEFQEVEIHALLIGE